MKEIKSTAPIYLNEFDVEINPYLTYAQIQNIVNAVCQFDSWAEREQNIDILVLCYTGAMSKDEIEKNGHNILLQSGLIDAVKENVKNLNKVYEAINYTQSTQRALAQILKEMPKIMEPLERVVKHGNKSSKK